MTVDLESLRGHTPGPWKFDKNLGCKTIRGGKSGPTKQAQYTELADTHGLNNEETDTANARLIAAAPALLAELTARRARDAEVEALVDKADTAATVLSNLIAARQVDSGYSVYVTDLTSALLPFTGDKT